MNYLQFQDHAKDLWVRGLLARVGLEAHCTGQPQHAGVLAEHQPDQAASSSISGVFDEALEK